MLKKTAIVASISASLILGASVPAIASGLNIINGSGASTGTNIVQINSNTYKVNQASTTTSVATSVTSIPVQTTTTTSSTATIQTSTAPVQISVSSASTGTNEIQITSNMNSSNQVSTTTSVATSATSTPVSSTTTTPPTVATSTPTTPVQPIVVTTPTTSGGSSVISLKGITNNNVTAINGVTQQTPVPAAIVPITLVMATSMTDDEQQMVDMINQDRARNGLPALQVDLRLVSAARAKSEDIKANKYFTHVSPNWGYTASLFPQMGLNVNYWAENVGAQLTVVAAEDALEADIPHQQNILDPNINYVGVGIAYNSIYGNVYTQEFVKE